MFEFVIPAQAGIQRYTQANDGREKMARNFFRALVAFVTPAQAGLRLGVARLTT